LTLEEVTLTGERAPDDPPLFFVDVVIVFTDLTLEEVTLTGERGPDDPPFFAYAGPSKRTNTSKPRMTGDINASTVRIATYKNFTERYPMPQETPEHATAGTARTFAGVRYGSWLCDGIVEIDETIIGKLKGAPYPRDTVDNRNQKVSDEPQTQRSD